jgi:Fur family transcriptional regulator, stress-responsive regulator
MPDEPAADHVATLRDHDLQVTAQRLAVLRAVTAHPHGTANELADEVRNEIGAISRQSVYDTLTLLTERHVLRRIQPAGSSARYEDRVGDNHHHLVCRRCDRLVDVDCAVGESRVSFRSTPVTSSSTKPRSSTGASAPTAGERPTDPTPNPNPLHPPDPLRSNDDRQQSNQRRMGLAHLW